MPSQVLQGIENNFTKGLVSEFTGLNFPENAATDADNVTFTLVGDTIRRQGINLEANFANSNTNTTSNAKNTYVWKNVGGDGSTQLMVTQVGEIISFYSINNATTASSLSAQKLVSTVNLGNFQVNGTVFNSNLECDFADGNGYLYIYHPSIDPIYCTYNAGAVSANTIIVKIRDFVNVSESGVAVNDRPVTLTQQHLYNLTNKGWTQGSAWQGITQTGSPPTVVGAGNVVNTIIQPGFSITLGDQVTFALINQANPGGQPPIPSGSAVMSGNVTAYNSVTGEITVSITGDLLAARGLQLGPYFVGPYSNGYVNGWKAAIGNYPSNADVWWLFKRQDGVYDPGATISQVTLNTGPAPSGHFILSAFNQQRTLISAVSGLTDVATLVRPRTGAWFQGRVWYTGVDASMQATGDSNFYTWTEKLYFSKVVNTPDDFGACYQNNDPTSENLFDLLPTDGGVIAIQGSGAIYKLFPIQNGMLVFAANGIWYITGSQGIGFAANDYTVTKISSVQSISGSSFVNVLGLPYFWNEEGIQTVMPGPNGGLQVSSITFSTIDSTYNEIPLKCKRLAKGDYNPIDYVIQWTYRDTNGANIAEDYKFNRILNYSTANKAFYTYTVDNTFASINGIKYIAGPGGSTSPPPTFKYLSSYPNGGVFSFQFSQERDSTYTDWASTSVPLDYSSYFVTGYKLHGKAVARFQMPYIYVYSRTDEDTVSYYIQGLWDYTTSGNSGRWSVAQYVHIDEDNRNMVVKRHRIRGQGLVLQIKVKSVSGQPFDIMGWSTFETTNTGV